MKQFDRDCRLSACAAAALVLLATLGLNAQQPDGDRPGKPADPRAKWTFQPPAERAVPVVKNQTWPRNAVDRFVLAKLEDRGLVPTPRDFGHQGKPPSHPELLDYLARHFVESGWSIKAMHRQIMLSRTYQLASTDDRNNLKVDPNNELLWKFSRRRLDAESIRDAMLTVSGQLDRSVGGPHPFPDQRSWDFTQHKPFKAVYETNRRSVYLMTQRIQRHPYLATFDGPDTNASTAQRVTSTTPLHALYLTNDSFVHEQARHFAARLIAERSAETSRVERAYQLALGRSPSPAAAAQSESYIDQVRAKLRTTGVAAADIDRQAWESFSRAIFRTSEFVYID